MSGLSSLASGVPLRRACESVGFSRATFYRRRTPATKLRAKRGPRKSPRALKPDERDKVIAALHAPEFADQPPREIYAALLSLGIFLCSPRTMYRILASLRQSTVIRSQMPRVARHSSSRAGSETRQVLAPAARMACSIITRKSSRSARGCKLISDN